MQLQQSYFPTYSFKWFIHMHVVQDQESEATEGEPSAEEQDGEISAEEQRGEANP